MAFGKKPDDGGFAERQQKQEESALRDANRLKRRNAAALRAMRAGAGNDLLFAGAAGLNETLGAGGVRSA